MKRCQVVLSSPEGMTVQVVAKLTLLGDYHFREMMRTFNQGGLAAIRPKKPRKPRKWVPKLTEEERASVAELAQIPPKVLGYPFNSWSLSKLQQAMVDRDVLNGKKMSDEEIRLILKERKISYQRTKARESNDSDVDLKKGESQS